jgi:hypothetical protein
MPNESMASFQLRHDLLIDKRSYTEINNSFYNNIGL